jgi:SAM-dependent methyltransferase
MTFKKGLKRVPGLQTAVHVARRMTGYDPHSYWANIVMDQQTARLIGELDCARLSALEISGQKWKHHGFCSYRSVWFPHYDVCSGALDERFDVIIAEQVFEHLLWPHRATRNLFRMLNLGGALLVTTPFLIKIHNDPVDCSRWTETGIRYLLAEAGFDLDHITTGAWGNRACIRANWKRWTAYRPWQHSLKNEPDFPIHVWALARKGIAP